MKNNRITENEERLDNINISIEKLDDALKVFKSNIEDIELLNKYYGSKEWFKDKEDYEKKKIPQIKAGVLSEDSVWNMNEDINEIIEEIKTIVNDYTNLKNKV